jgi:hypothetical protein
MATTTNLDPEPLRSRCRGGVTFPADSGWDLARQPWNVAVDQHPRAVVHAADGDDIAAVVDVARGAGLRVAVQGTGHGAEHIESLEDAILIRTSAMAEVEIDPAARRARVGAGALWEDVTAPPRRMAWLHSRARRRTWASSATRSAAEWAGSLGATAWPRTA